MAIGLVTCRRLPDLPPDDRLLLAAIERLGVEARPVVWDDPTVEWHRFELLVLRSVWDYSQRLDQFLDWIERASLQTSLANPPALVSWNSHKRYLLDVESAAVPTVPTAALRRGMTYDLAGLSAHRGWNRVVLKPAVSADARDTHLIEPDAVRAGQVLLDRLLAAGDVLVQPFRESIRDGEFSFVFFDGAFSHAVRKIPAGGEFRVQEHHGGGVIPTTASAQEVEQARRVLACVPQSTLYARVDMVPRSAAELELVELELIEPSLFLAHAVDAADRLAAVVLRWMEQAPNAGAGGS